MADKKRFYLTTAIDYPNSRPHIGTAFEKIGADVQARYRRMEGFDVHFLMGNDENTIKVARRAAELGREPKEYCDDMAGQFQEVWRALEISHDDFIQTSEARHHAGCRKFIQTVYDNGHIYKGAYEGLYCEGCEEFKVEKDLVDGKCPRHLTAPRHIAEKNYFFALSRFSDRLKEYIETTDFILPEIRRNEILKVIEGGLEDVSVSRSGKSWGVPLPVAPDHVVYVWFDALINYVSALGFGPEPGEKFRRYWPADCHVIGKDITRFHCLIWPAMLMAADIEVPRCVFGHGFVYNRGEKMSKTIGNIVDPNDLAAFFGADALRYSMADMCTETQDIRMHVGAALEQELHGLNVHARPRHRHVQWCAPLVIDRIDVGPAIQEQGRDQGVVLEANRAVQRGFPNGVSDIRARGLLAQAHAVPPALFQEGRDPFDLALFGRIVQVRDIHGHLSFSAFIGERLAMGPDRDRPRDREGRDRTIIGLPSVQAQGT